MDVRTLGGTGRKVSVVGLGTWQLGADWGDVTHDEAIAVLDSAATCAGPSTPAGSQWESAHVRA